MLLEFRRYGTQGMPVLVLLHGMGSASTVWKPLLPNLVNQYDVITLDFPGHGETPFDPGSPMDPASLGLLVTRTLERIGITKANFVGNSLGGWVALEIAAHQPDKVISVTGLAPAGLWLNAYTKIRPSTATSRHIAKRTQFIQPILLRMNWSKRIGFAPTSPKWRDLSYETCLDAARAMGRCDGYFPAWYSMLYRRFDAPISERIPITIVFGDQDKVLPAYSCQERSLLPPHARWIRLSDCGHAPQWDCVQDVANLIKTTVSA